MNATFHDKVIKDYEGRKQPLDHWHVMHINLIEEFVGEKESIRCHSIRGPQVM